ncbi:BTB domain-containing protein [Favolaschia claudopus]|uniref:BTB domain-containing protein n=1 Tax=Favolaschia claudopus TaxID=2862362 RepID=A0AAW0BFN8_9AGAR
MPSTLPFTDSEPPPAKRQRTDDIQTIRRSDIWNSDGSVVLQAETIQFRVHWSILARNSSFFRDMQSLPQPPNQPCVEGCPVVEVCDKPSDVENLLKALYDPTFLCQKVITVSAVGALLRLGRKYDFKDLYQLAVSRLTSEYPANLDEFDALPEEYIAIEGYNGATFDLVNIASDNSIMSILPGAYFFIINKFTTEEIFQGVDNEDGTRSCLAPIHIQRCVSALQTLIIKQAQPNYTFGWALTKSDSECTGAARCNAARIDAVHKFVFNPTATFYGLVQPDMVRFNLCARCTSQAKQSINTGRSKIWDELPEAFGLAPWDELKNEY